MTTVNNPAAMLRVLIVYAICVPLAVIMGYMLTNPLDTESIFFEGVLVFVLIFPLLMKFHYPLLVFSCSLPATMFFIPGRPNVYIAMIAISLSISVVERILNRNQRFLTASVVKWPLLAMLGVVYMTAKLTGGFGLRSFGGDVYGGKKYVFLIVGVLSFFAFIARPIPKKYANWYMFLYLSGGLFSIISDSYQAIPTPLHFIFLVFSPSITTMATAGGNEVQVGVTRLSGVAGAAGTLFFILLARYGIRGIFLGGKLWRPVVLLISIMLILLGGFRSAIIGVMMILGLLFIMEKMYRTAVMPALIIGGLMVAALVVPLASHLPYTFQRSLAFLPLDISPEARMDAEGSTEWRLAIWQALLPEIPEYLLLGKGYSFSAETYNEDMGMNATFQKVIDPSQNALALSSDFHSGPLSVVIPFGIWGVLCWIWYMIAGFWVVWRNYCYGDGSLRHINTFFLASYVSKVFSFIFIFGNMPDDVGGFAAIIGLSIAINHGVMRPRTVPRVKPASSDSRLPFPARPALQHSPM